jgi:hypothetical protein
VTLGGSNPGDDNKMDDDPIWKRAEELREELGLDLWQSLQKAVLERNIKNWPSEWGDNVLVQLG